MGEIDVTNNPALNWVEGRLAIPKVATRYYLECLVYNKKYEASKQTGKSDTDKEHKQATETGWEQPDVTFNSKGCQDSHYNYVHKKKRAMLKK